MDHIKLVYCIVGSVQDVVLDLRRESTAFGKYVSFNLSENDGQLIYIPKRVAHGFLALEKSILVYNVSVEYSPEHDCEVLWSSFKIPWKFQDNLIISNRDKCFMPLSEGMNFFE